MYILLDIGGTKTRIAGSMDLEQLGTSVIIDSKQNYKEGLDAILEAAQQISGGATITGVAGGVKGVLSEDKRTLLSAAQGKLLDWKDKSLATDLEALLHAPVRLENDTAVVGLGEAVFGAGKGVEIVVYTTVSTGVNGVRVVNGAIDISRQGFETGGQYVSMNPPKTVEELVSGTAVTERFGVLPINLGKESPVWEELARVLAFAIHNTILHWSPDKVVIGGSMMNEIGISVPRVAEHVKSLMRKFPKVPEIVHSSLGDVGGLWGAMALLKQKN
ncbi:MAG: hypothetical protein RIQ56_360 [Candidatus Parcubacteria bacterium]|jgi:predicted NBD/HSP70 family sugar kinase